MGGVDERVFGALERDVVHLTDRIKRLEEAVDRLETSIDRLTDLLNQARGGWKIVAGMFGAALALGGLAVAVWRSVR